MNALIIYLLLGVGFFLCLLAYVSLVDYLHHEETLPPPAQEQWIRRNSPKSRKLRNNHEN